MSEEFIRNLAEDCTLAKKELRRMMRRSQYWREDLQAWAIPLVHKQTPNRDKLIEILGELNYWVYNFYNLDTSTYYDLQDVKNFFSKPDNVPATDSELAILERLAPRAYREGQSKRKTLEKLFKRLDIWDNDKNSAFQRHLREYEKEWAVRNLPYTLYVSVNPAHFLIMSNPKGDKRGESLVSCHSFNGYYEFSSGCIGYARDSVSLIAFTAAN